MAEINYIRHEANNKGCGYASVAKKMGKDQRTVDKYADMDVGTVKRTS